MLQHVHSCHIVALAADLAAAAAARCPLPLTKPGSVRPTGLLTASTNLDHPSDHPHAFPGACTRRVSRMAC